MDVERWQIVPTIGIPSGTDNHSFTSNSLKLRNTCKACAASKLKCSQWKPSCARCLKRQIPCEYIVAKRGGRKPKGWCSGGDAIQTSHSPAFLVQSFSQASEAGLSQLASSTKPIDVPSTGPRTLSLAPSEFLDPVQNLWAPLSASDTLITPQASATFTTDPDFREFSDFFTYDGNPFGSDDLFPLHGDTGSLSPLETQSFSHSGQTSSEEPFGDDSEPFSPDREKCLSASQTCFTQALGLMKQLSVPLTVATMKGVIAHNEVAIEALDSMLQCACSQDGYLLALMALSLSKILDGYTLMARNVLRSQDNGVDDGAFCARPTACARARDILPSRGTGGVPKANNANQHHLEDPESSRMVAQRIVSVLYRLKRLVDKLSTTLTSVEAANKRDVTETIEDTSNKDFGDMVQDLTPPFPSNLHSKLKMKLQALSTGTIETLRRL